MKFWFDTEFIEDGKTIDLLSIGVVAEDGRVYYAEPLEARIDCANAWVKENVLVFLTGDKKLRSQIAADLINFMGEKPEIWAYYADYDWVALCQLFGTMMDLPKGWPMYCRDVKQLCDSLGNHALPTQTSQEHHALSDAIWAKQAWEYLQSDRPVRLKGFDFWTDASEETREMWRGVASAFILFLFQSNAGEREAFYTILKKYIPQEPIDQAWQELKEAGLAK